MNQCIESYGGLVWSIARKYTRSEADAEDLTQEIFTALWRNASRFRESTGSETTFIGMLARRRAIDSLRRQGRHPNFEPLAPNDSDMSATSQEASSVVDYGIVMEALQQLPKETQNLFQFHFERGMSHSEIAEQTGVPLGTVKTKLRSGLLEIRNLIKKLDSESQPGGLQ
ncbi:MAG: sigma-70 family RNA polymerase sigma factor [Verrucomicrobiota bacterium]